MAQNIFDAYRAICMARRIFCHGRIPMSRSLTAKPVPTFAENALETQRLDLAMQRAALHADEFGG
ncbi:hypothetical protein, partial [Pseudoxanthomonas sp. KAs_5_3]|uniref:hypothetical protein n=1 Tax=Pseudoxanthomonas sp. KAs_5_3 TaxID=2067658 RepID=UPI001E2E00E6